MTLDTSLADTPMALALDGVSFAYRGGGANPVVRDVTLHVAAGEMVGLLGPNGAGKSTLLRLATGLLKPATGSIRIQGDDVHALSREQIARRIAVVPQDFSVQFAYTVRQIVELGRMPHLGAWGTLTAADRRSVEHALATTNTLALADHVFQELSGGERQRVLLALALAQDAPIVLLDEPTAHLDIKHQIEALELLRRLNAERGLTVIAILHDLNLAARYFDRLALLQRTIVADGPPAHVLDAALLSRVYETNVQVGILRGEEHLSVLPPGQTTTVTAERIPERDTDKAGPHASVHVIAGGGSGELLMRSLADARLPFTAGPLNVGDSDHALAQRLALHCITEPPYASISPQAIAATGERIATAGALVVCPMPLGAGNIALLELALAACRAGTFVVLLEPAHAVLHYEKQDRSADSAEGGDLVEERAAAALAAITQRDFTGRGVELYEALATAGGHWADSPSEVTTLLQYRKVSTFG
ncbi:MAG: ABC transporter ATP-binding protein [Ktedonobacterales bacterium]